MAAGVGFILGFIAVVFLQHAAAQGTSHVVGDATGWTNTAGPNFYSTWASGKSFVVGDSLVFNFTTNAHDVLEVPDQASFNACSFNVNDEDIKRQSPVTEMLDDAGMHYYVCTIGQHCLMGGQKLSINVSATARTGGPMTPSSPLPPSSSSPPSPPGSSSSPPPPPSPSSSNSVMASLYVTLSAILMALF